MSSSGQEPLDCLSPLSARDIIDGDLIGPGTRQVLWRAEKEDEVLMGTPVHYVTVEFQRFRREVSANVEHDEIVDVGLPEETRSGDLFSFMHLDSVSSQNGGAYLARSLKAVDEENFLVGKNRAVTTWWAIHRTLPETSAPSLGRVIRTKSAPSRGGSQQKYKKHEI